LAYLSQAHINLKNIYKVLGPGILFASTCIGVSHLVQSTRAGAAYGFALLWAIIAANVFKYPFFEFGSRYANATGTSLIDGYNKMGKVYLSLYFLITISSMFFVTAAVGFVTAGFLDNLLGLSNLWPSFKLFPVALVFVICLLILIVGKYNALDGIMKVVGAVLLISTILAFILALAKGPVAMESTFQIPKVFNDAGILFLIALMGWMPTAVDLSAWNSLWTIARIKQTGYKPTLKETLLDFNLGYWVSAILSICFVTLGALLIFGTGITLPSKSADFANMVVQLYTATIGNWSYIVIAAAAFSIMFGTSLGVFDGYARSLERITELLFYKKEKASKLSSNRKVYNFSLIAVGLGAYLIIAIFLSDLKQLVDLATTISFLIAPFIAIVNFRLVTSEKYIQKSKMPPKWLKILSYLGIVFLTSFSLFYIGVKLEIINF